MASNALWVDKAQVSGSKFTAGTVKLTAGPAAPVLWKVNGYPGYSQVTPITVTNTGSMAMRYAVTGYETGGMAPVLKIEAKAGVTSCTAAGFTATGTSILAAKTLTVNTETALIGSTVAGAQSGDRTLAVGASEVLCFRITEDTSAGNAYMSTTGTLRLTVTGEQTKNN